MQEKQGAEQVHAADVELARAAAEHDAAALTALEPRLRGASERALRRIGAVTLDAAELAQLLREHLLVAPKKVGGPPRLARYTGRSPLDAWMTLAARRLAIGMLRRRDVVDLVTREVLGAHPSAEHAPEQLLARAESRAAIRRAFDRAFAQASLDDRNLLRLSLLDRLGPDELGAVLGVHRATAARQLAQAKLSLRARVERELAATLGLSGREAPAWLAEAHSLIDVSLERLLGQSV